MSHSEKKKKESMRSKEDRPRSSTSHPKELVEQNDLVEDVPESNSIDPEENDRSSESQISWSRGIGAKSLLLIHA